MENVSASNDSSAAVFLSAPSVMLTRHEGHGPQGARAPLFSSFVSVVRGSRGSFRTGGSLIVGGPPVFSFWWA